jgi:predicted esterase
MDYKTNQIPYMTTGRYTTHGDPKTAKTLFIALHGYGQLSTFFIRKFRQLPASDFFVICPEGPHRFYQKGSSGRVGASWMTKEDRLNDIQNYLTFLDTLLDNLTTDGQFDRIVLLGFSQGGATAARWLAHTKLTIDHFILWAAVFPPDLGPISANELPSIKNTFVIGDEDEFITIDQANKQHNDLLRQQLPFEFVIFKGTHDINFETLYNILR